MLSLLVARGARCAFVGGVVCSVRLRCAHNRVPVAVARTVISQCCLRGGGCACAQCFFLFFLSRAVCPSVSFRLPTKEVHRGYSWSFRTHGIYSFRSSQIHRPGVSACVCVCWWVVLSAAVFGEASSPSADISKFGFASSSSMTCMLVERQPPGPELPAFSIGKLLLPSFSDLL